MKAIVYTKHGGPEVLRLMEIDNPVPKGDEVLVRVHAASLNALDSHMMRGFPPVSIVQDWFPKKNIPGADLAGRVEAVGSSVTRFKVGDEVFGAARGSFAEYTCARERNLTIKPPTVSFEDAASSPVAALTAVQALRDHGQLKPGQHVLVQGAGGGVGTFTVSVAKALGAQVTAVCSARNESKVRSLGADYVVDYKKEDITKTSNRYDLIIAVNGFHLVSAYKQILDPNGILVAIGADKSKMMNAMFNTMILGPILFAGSKRKIRLFIARINPEDLAFIAGLLESGKVNPVIDRTYPLDQAPDAIRQLEQWHTGGKIVISIH